MPRFSDELVELVKAHEGCRLKRYKCPGGAWTIGYGHNLDEFPLLGDPQEISAEEAETVLRRDLVRAELDVRTVVSTYDRLSTARQEALIDMAFNLGRTRLRGFRDMMQAVENEDWKRAALEMISSRWAHQCPKRVGDLAAMMKTGKRLT